MFSRLQPGKVGEMRPNNLISSKSRTVRGEQGDRREQEGKTEWHRVVIFSEGPRQIAEQY